MYASRLPSRSSPRIHRPRLRGFLGLRRSLPRANAASSSSSRDRDAILNPFARSLISEKQAEEEIIREKNQILYANIVYSDLLSLIITSSLPLFYITVESQFLPGDTIRIKIIFRRLFYLYLLPLSPRKLRISIYIYFCFIR